MRREDRAVVGLLGFLHGAVHANLLAIPVFLNLPWRSEFQADSVVVGLLAATTYACFGFSSVPFGFLADRRSPTRLLMLSAGGIAVSLGSLGLSPNLPWLALSLAGLGLSSGIYHPTALAAISRSVQAQGAAMGWHGMGGSLGIALGPAFVAATLASGWPWRDAVAVLVLPPLVGLALLATRFPPVGTCPPAVVATPSRSLASVSFVRVLLVYFFAGIAYQGALSFLPLPRFLGGGLFAVALGLGAVGQVVAGTLADRRRPDRILTSLSLTAAVLLSLLAAFLGSAAFLVGGLAFGFVLFSLEALQNTLVTRTAPHESRGLAFGLSFFSVFGLGSIGAVLAGWLLDQGQPAAMFLVLSAAIASSGVIAYGIGATVEKT